MPELQSRFRATATERNEFLDDRDEAEQIACTTDTGGTLRLALSDMMLHVCNHGFHHRAQALNMLRHVGADTPDLDYVWFKVRSASPPATDFDPPTIAEYYRYNDWARDRVLDAVETLDDADLERRFEMGLGSVRKILLHTRDAEQWWFQNWSGMPAADFEPLPETLSIGELRECFGETARRRNDLLATLHKGDLQRECSMPMPLHK